MPWDIFVSFEEEDIGTVEVFREHVEQEDIELVFHEYAIKKPFDSEDALEIQVEIAELLEKSSVTLVLIGRTTYADKWVDWEVRTSASMGKALLGMRLHSELDHIVPRALKDLRVEILDPNIKSVVEAIERKVREEGQSHYETS